MDVLERMLLDQTAEPTDLPLSLLQKITHDFSDDQQIGTGGFAVVYKGILQNGVAVAVKKLRRTLDIDEKKFNQEVQCLMKTQHKNVVRFLGYCADTQGKTMQYEGKFVMADLRNRLLCFEYVPTSLDKYITDAFHGLEWRDRYRMIKGISEGLHYLHDKRIVHLDLKPANILVDASMTPKIADFGLSRCFDENQSRTITSKLVGSMGYLAPESYKSYNSNRQITFNLDIYSLGVIIMEILTGERGYSSIEDVVESWKSRLEFDTLQVEQVRVCTEIGIECMNLDPAKRPVAQHIIDRLDRTASADCCVETGTSNSSSSVVRVDAVWFVLQQAAGNASMDDDLAAAGFVVEQVHRASAEVLGYGTYGTVYRATLRDGSVVAVKMLWKEITRHDAEFVAEAEALVKIRHPNLLPLRAYYLQDHTDSTKALLFDFMRKGSLDQLLHARSRGPWRTSFRWATRMAIAKGTARGLAYLHDDVGIVHGNLTSRNVLLDDSFAPKIAGFGMSRLVTAAASSNVVAPMGYRAPELAKEINKASAETDVYSLGVILLQLLTGEPPANQTNGMDLPQWVRSIAKDEQTTKLFDWRLTRDAGAGEPEGGELMDTLNLALQCVNTSPSVRPKAREVLRRLEEIRPGPDGGAGPSDQGHVAPASSKWQPWIAVPKILPAPLKLPKFR